MPARPPRPVQLEREDRIWELSARGWSLRRIGKKVGMSPEGVRKAIERVFARESAAFAERAARVRVRHEAAYRYIHRAASLAFDKSRRPIQRARQNADGTTTSEVVTRTGDPQFLYVMIMSLGRIEQLWGANVLPAANPEDLELEQEIRVLQEAAAKEKAEWASQQKPPQPEAKPDGENQQAPD
jgi:hypothetical protein